MEKKNKFVLEFDKAPAFVYVVESPDQEHIYLNGHKVRFWHSLKLESNSEDVPEYEIKGYPIE